MCDVEAGNSRYTLLVLNRQNGKTEKTKIKKRQKRSQESERWVALKVFFQPIRQVSNSGPPCHHKVGLRVKYKEVVRFEPASPLVAHHICNCGILRVD